jgi:predicted RNase H-like HicB family nuclease
MPKTATIRPRTTPRAPARPSRRMPVRVGRLTYTVVFAPAEEGGYVVTVPALPGCITQGDTFTEARAMAEDAILGYIEALQKLHEDIPLEHGAAITRRIAVKLTPA